MTEFRAWMQAMGYNGKQVAKAGQLIGMGRSTALLSYRDERRLTKTERLAMAAAVAGLHSWEQAVHDDLSALRDVIAAVRRAPTWQRT